ncbi:aerobic-type carbon monoxide dehydrogenase, middle subunit CoxM/CutM-like protein [Hoeflea sp. IMCC20628]|uniref:FAD binding domain-containing protein n=1 Tax=Hoeflea sp. IMCC20628 TaxID=1620421 RepID=UPI00063B0873|nr:FAD binding domain-containing protein [Hoeflea sp. IMCC20628]AKI01899.1 aerobic-type carbon monoxide dehydrogenase, middle subunit CoxM/CutM-like protein [Hoeflea sp. IMCC20628]
MSLALTTFASAKEVSAALKQGGARYLGGGTLVVRAVNEGDIATTGYVRTTDPVMSGIDVSDGWVRIGASVTMAAVARCKDLAMISRAAKAVGGPAIRNMATVGGNLFAAAPYGDFAVALLALDATVHCSDGDMDVDAFLASRDDLTERGIVIAVSFTIPAEDSFRFLKVSRVKPKGVSVLSLAAVIETDANGTVKSARIALGCMADRPMRAISAEKALSGAKLTKDGIAEAIGVIGAGTDPMTDAIGSAWYRGEVLPVHFGRLLLD